MKQTNLRRICARRGLPNPRQGAKRLNYLIANPKCSANTDVRNPGGTVNVCAFGAIHPLPEGERF